MLIAVPTMVMNEETMKPCWSRVSLTTARYPSSVNAFGIRE